MRSTILAALGLTFLFLGAAPSPAFAAAPAPGDLVKLADDGNLETTADSAVYYVGPDGKRYVFPNAQTYFTWYADFSSVKVVSASELAALPIGGNVTYRPGTRLVKITSDPNVYAVEPGGTLRWVQSEAVASGLYGSQWNQRIDDIPDAFFFNYAIGEPLAAAVYPSGTVVKRSSDNAYFRIEDRTKRRIEGDAVRSALRIQDAFVITSGSDLSDYPDGAPIATAELAITDTSQKNIIALPSVPTFTLRQPATNFIATGSDVVLAEVRIASLKAVTVKKLTVKLDATTNNPADAALDDDKGGLIYQNNAQANFTILRFVDAGGSEVFGRKSVALDVGQDQSQTFTFTGAFSVPAGTEKTLYFRAQTNALLPNGEGYKVTLPVTGIELADASTGAAAAFAPSADLVGPTLTTVAAFLEVTASGTPGSKTYIRGAQNAEIAGFNFKATTNAPNVITSLTVQGYLDEENVAGFLAGGDADNGTETKVKDLVPAINLYETNGTKVAGPVAVGLDGRATFSGLTYSIPAGQTKTLIIRGDISSTVELENAPDKFSFDVTDAATDVAVVDDVGAKVNAKGALPNGGNTQLFFATVKKNGQAFFTWTGNGGSVIVGREALLGTLSVETKDDLFEVRTLTFSHVGTPASSLGDVRLEFPAAAGGSASATASFIGQTATFPNLAIPLAKDATTQIKLYGRIKSKDAGAVYGQLVKVQLNASGPLNFASKTSGQLYSESNIGSTDFTLPTNAASAVAVRFSGLTAAKDAATPASVGRDAAVEVARFTLKAEPEGPVRIKKLAFKLAPGDVGKTGGDNDALEIWSDVNGDFADDDGVANLVHVAGSNRTTYGEGSGARIMYSMVQGGVKKTEPSLLQSAGGDYAILEYVFDDGSEIAIGAGGTYTFSFELYTSALASGQTWQLGVDVMTAGDTLWTDVPSGSYTALTGTDASGFPLSFPSITVVQ